MDYPAVMKRLTKWGQAGFLGVAYQTRLSSDAAVLYVRTICGPDTIVRVKRTRGSWAYPHNQSITLGCDAARTVRLSSVLHECAHVLNYRKGRLADGAHGEAFCRTYARLLREWTTSDDR